MTLYDTQRVAEHQGRTEGEQEEDDDRHQRASPDA